MLFSQRIGIKAATKPLQLEGMDLDLKNGLWNILSVNLLNVLSAPQYERSNRVINFYKDIWHSFFKERLDEMPVYNSAKLHYIKTWFLKAQWFEVYDLLDFIINNDIISISSPHIIENFNAVLERESSGYRFVSNKLAPITNGSEIKEIEEAIGGTFSAAKGSNIHLNEALAKMSDKVSPDYRNSIKESISAVESIAQTISGNKKASLGEAIKALKGKIEIHPALEKGYLNIYGWTSDSSGIRHALSEEPVCDFEDAKYMLVSCSAFINYLIAKAQKAGVNLSE